MSREMTVNQLHKALGKLIEQGHARTKVHINKPTFTHNLEGDGCVILPVYHVLVSVDNVIDDDGGTKVRKDGRECYMTSVVLCGNSWEPTP